MSVKNEPSLWSQKTGSTDLFEVVKAWQASEFVEDKAMDDKFRQDERVSA